ncbi:MAG TPA: RelA/SpoT domain-containing protein [Roseateles sp.]
MPLSTTQLNLLGDRLRKEPVAEADLQLLDDYRRQFAAASAEVERVLREEFRQSPAAREAKSTPAIRAKLVREGTRLSTMQDVAGCRVVVPDRPAQRALVEALMQRFAQYKLVDRVSKPSHGYRALHLVVREQGRWVEVQVRTELEHLWAQLCELVADRVGLDFKYGEGRQSLRAWIERLSDAVDAIERDAPAPVVKLLPVPGSPDMEPNRDNLTQFLKGLVVLLPALPASEE